MNLSIPASTWVCLIIIAAVFFILWYLINKWKKEDKLLEHRRIVEYFPTAVSTLGVLGTFFGITMGLVAFDSGNLDQSIPGLLDGLKTAFFTSLAGMIGSMILSSILNLKQDKTDKGVSDINQAAGTICNAVQSMSEMNKRTLEKLAAQMEEQEKDRKAFYRTMGDVMDKVKLSQAAIAETLGSINTTTSSTASALDSLVILGRSQEASLATVKESIDKVSASSDTQTAAITAMSETMGGVRTGVEALSNISDSVLQSVGRIEEASASQTETMQSVQKNADEIAGSTHHLAEILDVVSGMSSTQDQMNDQVQKLKDILDGEVDQIERSMDKTNSLLERKFDEFTELLKKSNTEALVEVMKEVTAEFQKQMDALISKLIQENFDQLNKSVERLNQWQQDNKEMIASLTKQYKEMATNFETTSESLTRVKDDTESLVSEGGKLRKIVDSLNEVIVNDERFIKTAEHLQKTAELSQTNMEAFDASTKALNDWVRKQRNFVDSVQILLGKLEEIAKIKDYNEQFWAGTKKSLEEGVGVLNNTAKTLRTSLTDIDRQFYNRLNTTLAELDSCIQAMIKGKA
jgi:chromosome segregation ATPase